MKKAKEQLYKLDDVLDAWNYLGRSGLTVHALCTLTGIPPQKLIKILRQRKGTRVDLCIEILAPVVSDCNYYADNALDVRLNDMWLDLAEAQLKRWPWPKYKGISNGKGSTQSMNPEDLAGLEMHLASKGEEYAPRY